MTKGSAETKWTLAQARKALPDFACELGIYARSVTVLCDAVRQELEMYKEGSNPLTDKQVKALQNFLKRVEGQ